MKYRTKCSLLLAGLLGIYSHVSACVSPSNIEGVAFTDNEQLNLESLSVLGDTGVDYKVLLNESGGTTVCYPSHYNANGMVFIGNVGLMYMSEVTLNCLGIIIPQTESMMNNAPVPVEEFDFPKAVKVELEWLAENGVINTDQEMIDSIYKELGEQQNGGVQYWTKQHSTLQYNSWFTYDAELGLWRDGETEGVNGVVQDVHGCSVIKIPEIDKFDGVPVKETKNRSAVMNNIVINVQGRTLTVNGGKNFTSDKISIVAVSGRVMKVFKNTHTGQNQLTLNDIAPGTYIISCRYNGTTFNRSVFIQ